MAIQFSTLPGFLIQQAQRHLHSDDYLEALECLNETLAIDPNNLRARVCRAEIFEQLLDFESSIAELKGIIAMDETSPEADYAKGHLSNNLKKGPGCSAEDFYSRAIEKDAEFKQAYLYRGVQRFHAERYEEAIQDFTKAIDLDPNYLEAIYERSESYAAAGRIMDAVQDLMLYKKGVGIARRGSIR